MSKQLLIRFLPKMPGVDPALVSWCVVDAAGKMKEVQRGSLDEVAAHALGNRVLVMVPGIDVLTVEATVPAAQRQRLLKAVPYLLEEQLAGDVEDMHFALGERAVDGRVPCVVVARERMTEWMARLREYNLQPDLMVPDYLCLPWEAGTWTLYKDADGMLVRNAEQRGFFVEPENLAPLLEVALAEAGEQRPVRLRIIDTDTNTALPELTSLGVEVLHEGADPRALLQFLVAVEATQPVNLLQGDFSRREQMGKLWRPWRPAAVLFAVFVVVHLGMSGVNYFRYKKQSQALQGEIEQLYLSTFPEAKKVVNPRAQMEQKLAELRGEKKGGDGFLGVLGGAASVLKATPGMELRSLRYKDGKLDVDFTIKDLQALDKLKQNLAQVGVSVEILSANARADGVDSRMQLKNRGS